MSGKEFFFNRYRELGWETKEIVLQQSIRINNTNAIGKNVIQRLQDNGVKLEKIPFLSSGYWVTKSEVSVGATCEYLLGLYSIQEAAAQIPVSLFSDLRGKKVLDAAAAPGGKTIQLADLMNNSGIIVALDINKRRLTALSNQLERCYVRNTIVYLSDARQASTKFNLKFDHILLDVPCSGNFAADKNWFKNRKIEDIHRNAALQREILNEATGCLSDNGEMIYSTCSLEPEENEQNMDWVIKTLDLEIQEINCKGDNGLTNIFGRKLDPTVKHCKRIWPAETQGFFVCKLQKRKVKK